MTIKLTLQEKVTDIFRKSAAVVLPEEVIGLHQSDKSFWQFCRRQRIVLKIDLDRPKERGKVVLPNPRTIGIKRLAIDFFIRQWEKISDGMVIHPEHNPRAESWDRKTALDSSRPVLPTHLQGTPRQNQLHIQS